MRRRIPLIVGLVLAACSDPTSIPQPGITAVGPLHAASSRAEDYVAGQIIVRFRPGAARSEIAEAHRAHKKDDMRLARTEILEVAVGEEVATAAALSKNPNVEFAEPDYVLRVGPCEVSSTCNLPDGSFFNFKWDHYNTGSFLDPALGAGTIITGKADADIDWAELYDYLGGSFGGSAVIGILDTGIRPTHAMFVGKILAGQRFLGDAQPITNFIDDHGHGSHTAGIAAGRATAAVPGVAYGINVKLLIGKVCNSAGSCPSSAVANGIIWAADNGANVISMSLGSFGGNPDGTGSAAQQAALQYAASKNVLSVCSSGNDDGSAVNGYVGGIGYPARFPECMAVGATNWSDTKTTYSNYGPQLEISAPGGDGERSPYSFIISASRNGDNSYAFNAGTSMAAPQVAGVAAMMFATGMTSASAIRQRLMETADDLEAPGWDPRTGAGRVNAYRAVTGLNPNAPPVSNPGGAYAGAKGVAVAFDGSSSFDPNGKPVTFAWNFGDPTSGSNTSAAATPSHTYLRAGNYTVTLTVTDAAGLVNTATSVAAIPNIVPSVSVAGGTILQGETYSAGGSFTDADPDSWSATVNYGDGSGVQGVTLAGKSFSLSHRYMTAGDHTVSVVVSDNDGGNGVGAAVVRVSTPQDGIQYLLLDELNSGAISGVGSGQINALSSKLQSAQSSLNRGDAIPANNQLQAFTNQVQAFTRSHQISEADAAALIATARRILASINR